MKGGIFIMSWAWNKEKLFENVNGNNDYILNWLLLMWGRCPFILISFLPSYPLSSYWPRPEIWGVRLVHRTPPPRAVGKVSEWDLDMISESMFPWWFFIILHFRVQLDFLTLLAEFQSIVNIRRHLILTFIWNCSNNQHRKLDEEQAGPKFLLLFGDFQYLLLYL